MATTVWITEYSDMVLMTGGEKVQTPLHHPVAEQSFAFTSATNAAAFAASTRCISIDTNATAHIRIGGTATTANRRVVRDRLEYLGVAGGDVLSIVEGV